MEKEKEKKEKDLEEEVLYITPDGYRYFWRYEGYYQRKILYFHIPKEKSFLCMWFSWDSLTRKRANAYEITLGDKIYFGFPLYVSEKEENFLNNQLELCRKLDSPPDVKVFQF